MTSVCPSGDSRRSPQGSFPLVPRMRSLPAARLMACPMGVAEYRFVDLNTVFVDSTELSLCLKAALRPAKIGAARARDARGMHERCTSEGRIVRIRGLFAVLCLLASTPGAFAQIATAQTGQVSAYSVDGLALGERVQPNNAGYREYKCGPSHQFDGFTWCQKARQQKEPRRSFKVTYSLLHTRDGTVVYVNRYEVPAFFGPNEADEDIQRYSRRLGESARITKIPHRPGIPDGILATWGNVELKPLDSESIAAFRKGSTKGGTTRGGTKKGYFVDFIGNFARSVKEGLPIYRISGGAGLIWVASFDQKGRGTLRFAAVDASALYPEMLPIPQTLNTQNSDAQRARQEPALAEASTTSTKSVSGQQAAVAEKITADAPVAGQPTKSAERDAQVAQTEIERLNAERTELNAAIKQLALDKTTAEATIIIFLIVLAGTGAFVFIGRKKGPIGKHPSVKPETKEPPPTEPAYITKIEFAIEDVLWRHGVLTTDEIYRGVKAKHAQLGRLLPPKWQEQVRQLLEARCISHEGNSWSLEKLEPLEERPECGATHGTSERITNETNKGQNRTDWASTEPYQYLDRALPEEERPECGASLFEPHGTSERITNETNKGQNRTDWASTEPYQYLDRALPAM
jgi:hypothetical protein